MSNLSGYDSEAVGFASITRSKISETSTSTQTSEFAETGTGCQTNLSKDVGCSIVPGDVKVEMPSYSPQRLNEFLRRVVPTMLEQLDENEREVLCNSSESDEEDTLTAKLFQELDIKVDSNLASGDQKTPSVLSLSWSSAGNSLAVSLGHTQHENWCNHDGVIKIYTIKRTAGDKLVHSLDVNEKNCVSVVKYHHSLAALLAYGTVTGEVVIINMRDGSDFHDGMQLTSPAGCHGSKRVSALQWADAALANTFLTIHITNTGKRRGASDQILFSSGSDGTINVWQVNSNFKVFENVMSYSINGSKKMPAPDITCFDFIKVFPLRPSDEKVSDDVFVVGAKSGKLYLCKIKSKQVLDGNVVDPVSEIFDGHATCLLDVAFSLQRPGLFASLSIDSELRLYDINQYGPLKVNLQDCSVGLDKISYDLTDLQNWEHLLAGEPFHRRQLVGIDQADKRTAVETEKHLDMPASWVEKLDLSADEFEQRYPGSHKIVHYKKVLLEKFSPYSERDGIVKRISMYEDYALTIPTVTWQWYTQRVDKMLTSRIDHAKKEVLETFGIGRRDHLLKHTYAMDAPVHSVEGNRTLEFNYYARLDHLTKLVCTPLTFDEYYTHRDDRLESRKITYTEGTKLEPKRQVLDIVELFSRNPNIPAKDDVWKKIFHLQEGTIDLFYHYAYNFVTNDTRSFVKPNLAETGGKILFYPDKTSGYIADPCAPQPRPLNIYYALCENMECEYHSEKHIRDRETDINGYLKQRHRELTEPMLFVALFDTERNEAAKKGWKEQELQKAEILEREKEVEIDPLAPYLARMFGSGHGSGAVLTIKEATLVREQCINDFRAKQLARQNLVQERFDALNAEYKSKRLWYLANQYILSPEKEAAYFTLSAQLAFQVHALEVRLTRHKDLSAPRFKVLEDYLAKHPLLKEFNRMMHYYSSKSKKEKIIE